MARLLDSAWGSPWSLPHIAQLCISRAAPRLPKASHSLLLSNKPIPLRILAIPGGPPYVLTKGDAANGMTAGVPISAAPGPEIPGYTRYIASGLYGQPGYKCNSSIQ